MKLTHTDSPLLHSSDMQSSTMGMDSKGMEMATYYLRDKIYSNKILAVVREYICNALDEHKKHSVDVPINIILKNNQFTVRDYAKGLSEHDVRNVFGMYFRSTKSNDNSQTGGFGLGSKAAFCYTDTFFVKSYYDGVLSTYACSLGAGDNGISVGKILKVSEEPSNETGLEIVVDVQQSDVYEFNKNIQDFLYNCTNGAVYTSDKGEYFNAKQEKGVQIGDYTFRLVKTDHLYDGFINFCMGDVCYKSYLFTNDFRNTHKTSIIKNHYIIVDIPIGKLTLPISRESFENTEHNKRVLAEIDDCINQLLTNDRQSIQEMSLQQLIDSRDDFFQSGEYFSFRKNYLYDAELYSFVNNIKTSLYNGSSIQEKNGKKIVCLIPDKESADYWVNKFKDHCSDLNKNYYYISERFIDIMDKIPVLKESFIYKKVKSSIFEWPKSSPTQVDFNTRYLVYVGGSRWDRYSQDYSALELHNKSLGVNATSVEEAVKQCDNLVIKTIADLEKIVIKKRNVYGDSKYSCNSSKMIENLVSLGWYEFGSARYYAKTKEIREKVEKERERFENLKSCDVNFLHDHQKSKTLRILQKKEKYMKKYSYILSKIKNENSLRAKLFEALERNGYYHKISRTQLRKVLKLTD